MADFSYEDFLGWGDPNQGADYPWNSPMPADTPGWEDFIGWGGDETQAGWYQNADLDTSGQGGLWGTLGSLGSGALKMLLGGAGGGTGAGALGPLLSSLGAVGGGAIGSNAANEAARLQSQALNRGIDLQTAQWLQQQQNLAPYLQAGQGGLAQLQQLAGREQPGLPPASTQVQRSWYDAQMPETRPGWQPQSMDAGAYRWTPGQGPSAANFRYTPGQIPEASQYAYHPGAVPTLSGQELLSNDPGVAFRMAEGQKALESSAAARGGLLSGPTLAALQRQGQELSSQEYSNAFARASQQAQLREGWAQTASQLGWNQAESETRLREQVNQIASQQGWSQSQAEAAFREGMAQQASQQGFNQDLAGQQWNQGQQQQWQAEQYKRQLEQNQLMYGRDFAENEANYGRNQTAYRQQLAQHLLPWEQASTLANLGGQATSMYGSQGGQASRGISDLLAQLGSAQGGGAAGSGLMWNRALTGATNQLPSILAGLNA